MNASKKSMLTNIMMTSLQVCEPTSLRKIHFRQFKPKKKTLITQMRFILQRNGLEIEIGLSEDDVTKFA